jgi:hypothetical protein
MTQSLDQVFEGIIRNAEGDPNVIGFILGGSRGKGFATRHSDYDCTLVVTQEAYKATARRMSELPPGFDVAVHTIQSFAEHAAWNGPYRWDRNNWTHLRAQIDKRGGLIQQLVDEKGKVPEGEVDNFIRTSLDHYINQVCRSIKCLRDRSRIAHRLEAADSILPLLDVVFALHKGRLRPYYKYLRWELTEFPLEGLPWSGDQFLGMLMAILTDGSYSNQQTIFQWVDRTFRGQGYESVFEAWGGDLWIADYVPETSVAKQSDDV